MAKAPAEIRQAWANHNLIPVIGAGVSMGAAGLPNWPALLTKGIDYAKRNSLGDADSITALQAVAQAKQLLHGFGQLQDVLGGAPAGLYYQAFLDEVFSEPQIASRDILDALTALNSRLLVTTNYDRLLEQENVVKNYESVTWSQPARILSMLRGGRGIIHLHGVWDQTDTVILSASDYQRIVDAQQAKPVTDALFHGGVLLFIGCSLDGVQDPHLKGILDRFAALQGPIPSDTTPHYMLVAGKPDSATKVRLRKLGIKPISFGEDYSELPAFLRSIPEPAASSIPTEEVRARLRTLRNADSLGEAMQDARQFAEHIIFPGRKIRIGFAVKAEEDGRTVLRNEYILPTDATHNEFSYPQTLAAWALIEGHILGFPQDWDRLCDFALLKKLRKFDRIRASLLETDPAANPVLGEFLSAEEIRQRTEAGTLTIRDLYQHWVGRQPNPHYRQFISVPVPVVEITRNRDEPPEYGVLNIDSQEPESLLTDETVPLLKALSEYIALAFEHLARRGK
jgi:hypothetical protein